MTLILALLLASTVYASPVDNVDNKVVNKVANVDSMYSALRQEGLNHEGAKVLLTHAKLESNYGTKGVAKGTLNWWNRTVKKGGRIAYEYEHGKRVRKRWAVYRTYAEAAREQIRFLRRRYRGALTEASQGDWEGYLKVLRKKGYFGKT